MTQRDKKTRLLSLCHSREYILCNLLIKQFPSSSLPHWLGILLLINVSALVAAEEFGVEKIWAVPRDRLREAKFEVGTLFVVLVSANDIM